MTPPPPPTARFQGSRRLGPRPLTLHLTAALTLLLSARAGLPLSRQGLPFWKPPLRRRAEDLESAVASVDADAFACALDGEIRHRWGAILDGVLRYRRHPYRRGLADPPAVWSEGSTRLLDYGAEKAAGTAGGLPLLVVPSLVNRGYILDLSARRSLLRWLAGQGIRPLLLEWGRPGEIERGFSLTDYVAGRLERALDAARGLAGRPVAVAGYCMGGLLATALAQRRPADVAGLALLAAPWDFHAEGTAPSRRIADGFGKLDPLLETWGELPVEALQALFASLDPFLVARKFSAFAALDPESERAEDFVAVEDWLNDGVPLAGPVARECLSRWYGANDPARGLWSIAGQPVQPGALRLPVLAVIPGRDRIVPPASAAALADAVPGAVRRVLPLGHIGMIVSDRAQDSVWRLLADWLRQIVRDPGPGEGTGRLAPHKSRA